jgi:hypothetical protein
MSTFKVTTEAYHPVTMEKLSETVVIKTVYAIEESKTHPLYGHPLWGVPAVDGRPVSGKYDDPDVLAAKLEKNKAKYIKSMTLKKILKL